MTERQDHPLDLLPELALGVLPAPEAGAVQEHLAACVSCRAEYEELQRVVGFLPLAAEDREPSGAIRESLMERIAAEPRRPPGRVIRPRWQWYGAAAAAGLVLLAAGLGAGYRLGQEDTGDLEERLESQQRVVNAAAAGTLRVARAQAAGASATLLSVPGSPEGFVAISNPPALPEGKAFQAWFIRDGRIEPGAVFRQGDGVWLRAGGDLTAYGAVAFTIEDDAGARQPTQEPFIVIPVSPTVRAPW